MVDLKASGIIQIISSIIASGIFLFGISTLYSDFVDKPNVSARIIPTINGTSLELTNNGWAPATNLILTVESPVNITSYEVFTTENRTITVEEDRKTLVAKFPRFVHGTGSLIKAELFFARQDLDASNQGYFIYATYDQGSLQLTDQMQQATNNIPYGPAIGLMTTALLIFAAPYFYRRAKRDKRRWQNRYVSLVAETIYGIKKHCEDPSYFGSSKERALDVWSSDLIMTMARYMISMKGVFENEADSCAVDEFYRESASRMLESKHEIKDDKDTHALSQALNEKRKEIAEIAEKALGKVHWERYQVSMINIRLKASKKDYDPSNVAYSFPRLTKYERYSKY